MDGKRAAYCEALRAFCEAWKLRYRERYKPTPADCKQLRDLIQRTPAADLPLLHRAFIRYMRDIDPWITEKQRHSLRWFCTSGGENKYSVEPVIISEKEARSMTAGMQWLASTTGKERAR